jgi:hypothetical protein
MVKVIQTIYNGYHFRSRTEARWAVFFDSCGIKYSYEPEGYVFKHNGRDEPYLPDFRLLNIFSQRNLFLEVKGENFSSSEGYWEYRSKLRSFCEESGFSIILCCGIPEPKAYPILHGLHKEIWGNYEDYTYFTTDHGGSEMAAGIRNGQFRLWTCAEENQYVGELKPFCDIAKKARFEFSE